MACNLNNISPYLNVKNVEKSPFSDTFINKQNKIFYYCYFMAVLKYFFWDKFPYGCGLRG